MTSDQFFEQNTKKYGLIFIDGDHSYEQSLKDLNNALKCLEPDGFVVMHDVCPAKEEWTKPEALDQQQPYTGEVWKTIRSAYKLPLNVIVYPFDFGIAVISFMKGHSIMLNEIPVVTPLDLTWDDYSLTNFDCELTTENINNKKVSYFTSLYNTDVKTIERTAKCVLNQINPNWEWVCLDDSTDETKAKELEKFFQNKDPRIKYYRLNETSGGYIGKAKRRAASLCSGYWLAELDHDDLIMPNLTERLLNTNRDEEADFMYCNSASVVVNDDYALGKGEIYGDGFAMGYGQYRTTNALNPLTGRMQSFQECICCPINPKTIRHIVGIPNHVRVWRKDFYWKIGGHDERLWVGDDYELVVRSFVNQGRFLHLDFLGYLQTCHGSNATDERRNEIQEVVHAIVAKYDFEINMAFKALNVNDWAYDWHEKFGFKRYQYWLAPTENGIYRVNQVTDVFERNDRLFLSEERNCENSGYGENDG